tara:strand:+ start:764 stop:1267 length:504 start_codon:yes stop_codon:yes gene_type:complete
MPMSKGVLRGSASSRIVLPDFREVIVLRMKSVSGGCAFLRPAVRIFPTGHAESTIPVTQENVCVLHAPLMHLKDIVPKGSAASMVDASSSNVANNFPRVRVLQASFATIVRGLLFALPRSVAHKTPVAAAQGIKCVRTEPAFFQGAVRWYPMGSARQINTVTLVNVA